MSTPNPEQDNASDARPDVTRPLEAPYASIALVNTRHFSEDEIAALRVQLSEQRRITDEALDVVQSYPFDPAPASARSESAAVRGYTLEEQLVEIENERVDCVRALHAFQFATKPTDDPVKQSQLLTRDILVMLGNTELVMNDAESATRRFLAAAALCPESDDAWMEIQENLADSLWHSGRKAEAVELSEQIIERIVQRTDFHDPDNRFRITVLAGRLWRVGALAKAESLYLRLLNGIKLPCGYYDKETISDVYNLAELYCDQADYAKAMSLYQRAIEVLENSLGRDHHYTLGLIWRFGVLLQQRGRSEEALPHMIRVVEGHERVLGQQHPFTIASRQWLEIIREAVNP